MHLVNPRYDEVQGLPCRPSLADVDGPVDLVLLAVGDDALEEQLTVAAERDDRSAVVFGSAWSPPGSGTSLRDRLTSIATGAGMALCGGGCMGFVDLTTGLRAIGYLERDVIPRGPVALVSHSGSAFSALLRSRRRIGWTSAVSSGQELVTTSADYVEHALDDPATGAVALVLETVREPQRLRAALDRAAAQDVPVVLLAVGGSSAAAELVTAHSGALAGADATWEALTEAHGLLRVQDLDEMTDVLELLDRRAPSGPARPGRPASRRCTTRVPSGCSSPTSPTGRACRSPSCPTRPRPGSRGCSTPASRSATRSTSGAPGGTPVSCSGPACARWPTTRRWPRSRWPSTSSRSTTATTRTRRRRWMRRPRPTYRSSCSPT